MKMHQSNFFIVDEQETTADFYERMPCRNLTTLHHQKNFKNLIAVLKL
jgi:hypothetical protein